LRLIHGYITSRRGCRPTTSPFEVNHGHESCVADFIKRETQCLLYSVFAFANLEHQLPGSALRSSFTLWHLDRLKHATIIFAPLERHLERNLDFVACEAFEMRGRLQGL
jgi:hypothetical protein